MSADAPAKRGRKPSITVEMVERAALMVARGLTEEQACLVIGIKPGAIARATQRRRELRIVYARGQAQWLAKATERLDAGDKYINGLLFLLERRHRSQFAKADVVQVNNTVIALPQDQVNQIRAMARSEHGATTIETRQAKALEQHQTAPEAAPAKSKPRKSKESNGT